MMDSLISRKWVSWLNLLAKRVNPWLALLAGLAVSGTAALLIGIPALKLKGYYLAMATLGFGIIIYIVLNEAQFTGGPSGLSGIPPLALGPFLLNTPQWLCYVLPLLPVILGTGGALLAELFEHQRNPSRLVRSNA